MSKKRTNSSDSGLISSEAAVWEQTFVKNPVFSPPNNENNIPAANKSTENRTEQLPHQRPRSFSGVTRRSVNDGEPHKAGSPPAGYKNDSDTDQGIVPDVARLLLGNRPPRRSKSASSPTYSIHINSLYVYQQPTMPIENPLYQQLPVQQKTEETPPSPCHPQQEYQHIWTRNPEGVKYPAQHSYTSSTPARPSSLKLASSTSSEPSVLSEEKGQYSSHIARQYVGLQGAKAKRIPHLSVPTDDLSDAEEMEVMIRDKTGKSRRYRLEPIDEDHNDYVMDTSDGGRVYVKGITISDNEEMKDEAFSEGGSYPVSSSVSTGTSGTSTSAAIDTVVGDCKVTVDQTFQPSASSDNDNDNIEERLPTRHKPSDDGILSTCKNPSSNKSTPIVKMQPKSMHDPTYFDFDANNAVVSDTHKDSLSGFMSKSVPNIAISSKFDTCYECRYHKRRMFSRRRIPRECTLEGYHYVTDDNEISFMKEILNSEGKLGHWFITPLSNQPGYTSCLYVKTNREVTTYPIVQNKRDKLFIDFYLKKSFHCLCKLTEYYKSTHLPEVKINLGNPLPRQVFPDMNYGADGSGTLMGQYAGVKL